MHNQYSCKTKIYCLFHFKWCKTQPAVYIGNSSTNQQDDIYKIDGSSEALLAVSKEYYRCMPLVVDFHFCTTCTDSKTRKLHLSSQAHNDQYSSAFSTDFVELNPSVAHTHGQLLHNSEQLGRHAAVTKESDCMEERRLFSISTPNLPVRKQTQPIIRWTQKIVNTKCRNHLSNKIISHACNQTTPLISY